MHKIELIGKPNYKKLTEDYNFFKLFKKIEKKFDTCFLFESLGEESYISRYHILGFDPKYIIYPTHENLIIENKNGKIDKIAPDINAPATPEKILLSIKKLKNIV